MKKGILLIAASAMALTPGCMTVRTLLAANPEAVAAGVIYAEQRVGTDCVRNRQAGDPVDEARVARLLYARIGANVTLLGNMGVNLLAAINDSRTLTDELCGRPQRAPLTELPVAVTGPLNE